MDHDDPYFEEFFRALVALTRPGGYIVIEVPDCQRALDAGDCTTLWEEHTLYFTPATFEQSLRLVGLALTGYFSFYVIGSAAPGEHHRSACLAVPTVVRPNC